MPDHSHSKPDAPASPLPPEPVKGQGAETANGESAAVRQVHLNALGVSDWGIHFSAYTGKWFVHAKGLNLSDGVMLSGVTVHRDTPEQAFVDFMREIRDEGQQSQVIAVEASNGRRHYRWNGVAFAEVPDYMLPWADKLASKADSRDGGT